MQGSKKEKKTINKISIQEESKHTKNGKIHKKLNINDTRNLEIIRF